MDARWQRRLEETLKDPPTAQAVLQVGMAVERLRATMGGLHAVVAGLKVSLAELERGLSDLEADVARADEALDRFAQSL